MNIFVNIFWNSNIFEFMNHFQMHEYFIVNIFEIWDILNSRIIFKIFWILKIRNISNYGKNRIHEHIFYPHIYFIIHEQFSELVEKTGQKT